MNYVRIDGVPAKSKAISPARFITFFVSSSILRYHLHSLNEICKLFSLLLSLQNHHRHIFICFPPPQPPPPPLPQAHFYCFSSTNPPPPQHFYKFASTTTTTFLLFAVHKHYHHHYLHISITSPLQKPPTQEFFYRIPFSTTTPHFCCFPTTIKSTTTFLFPPSMSSLHHHRHQHISIVSPPPKGTIFLFKLRSYCCTFTAMEAPFLVCFLFGFVFFFTLHEAKIITDIHCLDDLHAMLSSMSILRQEPFPLRGPRGEIFKN